MLLRQHRHHFILVQDLSVKVGDGVGIGKPKVYASIPDPSANAGVIPLTEDKRRSGIDLFKRFHQGRQDVSADTGECADTDRAVFQAGQPPLFLFQQLFGKRNSAKCGDDPFSKLFDQLPVLYFGG